MTNLKTDVGKGRIRIRTLFVQFVPELKADTAWQSPRVFHAQHQRKQWEVVQERQTGIEPGLHGNNQHASRGEGQVEDHHCWQKEEEHCEEDGSE